MSDFTLFSLYILGATLVLKPVRGCINVLSFFTLGCRTATPCSVAVWEWVYIHHLVPPGPNQFCQHWEGEALFVLVLLSHFIAWIVCLMQAAE